MYDIIYHPQCTDDCSPEPTCVKSVVYPPNGDNGNCQAYVT